MSKYDFNAVVIGGGTAGLITSNVIAQSKAKVALVERGKMGGDCLNTGCVPSKALISSAKLMKLIARADDFGIKVDGNVSVDFGKVMNQIQDIIDYIAPIDSRERYTSLGCDCFEDTAKILSPHSVQIGEKVVSTAHIVVATGGSPLIPPILGIEKTRHYTSENLWELREQPKRLLVIGSGPIGCELVQSFSRLGSEVSVVSMDSTLLPREDPDVSAHLVESFARDKVNLILSAKINEFQTTDTGSVMVYEIDGTQYTHEFDELIVAAGRRPNSQGIGLEEVGVILNPNKSIKVNDYLRSNVKSIWACGDVAGPYQFTHMASHQAGYVAMNILATPFKRFAVDYSQVPWVTYTDPEVARVGYNETEAKAASIEFEVTTYPFDHQDRSVTERDNSGFVKVLTKPKSDQILGVTIVGPHAGELLAEFNIAVKNKLGLKGILKTIHPYPTYSEANMGVASAWRKKRIPDHLLGYAEKYFRWKRS